MMKMIFTTIFLMNFCLLNAQVLCGTAPEGGAVTLTAPAGNSFTTVNFASYGTPDGSCGSFTLGTCHAANSMSIVQAALIGKTTATIEANNGVFGDPCNGTVKRLYIQATYSLSLPLKLVSFTGAPDADRVVLKWRSEDENNFLMFVIERSTDGILFQPLDSVAGTGSGNYQYTDHVLPGQAVYYYRLRMVDQDQKYRYSVILRIYIDKTATALSVFPSPAGETVTVTSNSAQAITVYNLAGSIILQKQLIAGSEALDISRWQSGVYIMKGEEGVVKIIKR